MSFLKDLTVKKFLIVMGIFFTAIICLNAICFYTYYSLTQNTFSSLISYQKPGNGKDAKNVIGLADDPFNWGEIRNDDEVYILKFDSGRHAGKLAPGRRCEITTYGWRNGFLSLRPNLIEVHQCR